MAADSAGFGAYNDSRRQPPYNPILGTSRPEMIVLIRAIAEDAALPGDHLPVAPAQNVRHVNIHHHVRQTRTRAAIARHVARVVVVAHDAYRFHVEAAAGEFADALHEVDERLPPVIPAGEGIVTRNQPHHILG